MVMCVHCTFLFVTLNVNRYINNINNIIFNSYYFNDTNKLKSTYTFQLTILHVYNNY